MSSPAQAPSTSEAQRWREWQERGLEGDRRRAGAMRWVIAIIVLALGTLLGRLW
jgi:hypothetical protein